MASILGHTQGTDFRDDDPLLYLPCSTVVEHRKGQIIYSSERHDPAVYLVISGMVAVSRILPQGRQVILDVHGPDEFFGETALLDGSPRPERAVALEKLMVMMWTPSQVKCLILERPKLGIALLRILAQREIAAAERLERFSLESVPHRLAWALLHFADRLGIRRADGFRHMRAFTQEFLSDYVGTSREIVNISMNRFRSCGYLKYSRHEIVIDTEALKRWLNQKPVAESASTSAAGSGVAPISPANCVI